MGTTSSIRRTLPRWRSASERASRRRPLHLSPPLRARSKICLGMTRSSRAKPALSFKQFVNSHEPVPTLFELDQQRLKEHKGLVFSLRAHVQQQDESVQPVLVFLLEF